jgi:phage nucleotide-binding protein
LTVESLGGLEIQAVSERLAYINMLVYGDPGAGKTVLAGSADLVPDMRPVIFIDVEGGTFSIRERFPDVKVVRVSAWDDMQSVYNALYAGKHEFRTVVLDSLTEIQKFSMYTIMEFTVAKDPDRDPDVPSMREWGKNIEQIRKLVRAFRDLPMHTIFTALAKSDKDGKTGAVKTKPSLSGKLADEVAGFVDIVGYQYTKVMDDELRRFLLTTAHERFVAKDRSDHLPPTLEMPTMEKIYELAFNETSEGE